MKLTWTTIKEEKILFPVLFTKYQPNLSFTKFLLVGEEYLFLFVELDVLIYKFEIRDNNTNLYFETKKSLDFISFNEEITHVEKSSNFQKDGLILISTNAGNIYILNFNLTDFFFDVYFQLNMRHNFIHEFQILFFEGKNILITIDRQLFSFEIAKLSTNTVIKNLLLRINDTQENIFSAYIKPKCYTVIFSNKNIYFINFEEDGTNEVIFKKDPQFHKFNYSGIVENDVIYYVKDNNSFAVYHIYDRENKFTVKLSAKNQLNDLNFFKVIHATSDMITITNEKQTELYFINNKYKLMHRESVLFDRSYFVFHSKAVIVLSLNLINLMIKYKTGLISDSKEKKENSSDLTISDSDVVNNWITRRKSIDMMDLNLIEDSYVQDKSSKQLVRDKINKKVKKVKIFINLLKSLSNVTDEKYSYYKHKITKTMAKINFHNKFTHKFLITTELILISIYTYTFGSYSLRKTFSVLYSLYFIQLYKEKVHTLLKLATHIKDYEVYSKLIQLPKNLF